MHIEVFVLILRQIYTNEQPHISHLLGIKNIWKKTIQIGILQWNSLQPRKRHTNSKQIIQWMSQTSWARLHMRELTQRFQLKQVYSWIKHQDCRLISQRRELLLPIFFTIYNKPDLSNHLNIQKNLPSSKSLFHQIIFRKTFLWLKAVAYRIIEIRSVDFAFMGKVAQHNNGVKFLLVVADVLSGYLRVQPMRAFYTTRECKDRQRIRFQWGSLKCFVKWWDLIGIKQQKNPSRHLIRGVFGRLKTSFTNTSRRTVLALVLKNCSSV